MATSSVSYSNYRFVSILKEGLDFVVEFGHGVFGGSEPGDRHALFVDHKLGEVPLDEVTQGSGLFVLHVLPHGVGVFAVDVDGVVHVEFDIVLGRKIFNVLDLFEFLVELVAGEG